MDFLNHAYAQVRELFQSMTPGARITSGLLLAVVVVSVVYLFRHGNVGPDEYLFGGETLTSGQLNDVQVALAEAGLEGWEQVGNRIRVPRGQKNAYWAAIADAGALPPNFDTILEDTLSQGGMWTTRDQKQQYQKLAYEKLLSGVIREYDWVEQAYVVYDTRKSGGLNRTLDGTASVSVKPVAGEQLDPRRKRNLQAFVSASVLGIKPEQVTIVNLDDSSSFGNGAEGYADQFENPHYRLRVVYESWLQDKILDTLAYFEGARVQVHAVMPDTLEQNIREILPGDRPLAIREMENTDETTQAANDGGGRPGTFAQGPDRTGTQEQLAETSQNTSKKSITDAESTYGYTDTVTLIKNVNPKEILATVAIPRSHVAKIWKQRNPPPPGQEAQEPSLAELEGLEADITAQVEDLVDPLLPRLSLGEDTRRQVNVQIVDSIRPEPLPEPTFTDTALAWTGQNWSMVTMAGLAMFSLLMLRSMVNAPRQPTDGAAAPPTLALHTEEPNQAGDLPDEDDEPPRPKLRLKKGHSLRDDLIDVVKEDPESAAAILKTWIGKAG